MKHAPLLFLLVFLLASCKEAEQPLQPTDTTKPTFSLTRVTTNAGLDAFNHKTGATGEKWFPETMGAGAAFLDYNGDTWLDILLVSGKSWDNSDKTPALQLFENNQQGGFTNVTQKAGLASLNAYGFGVSAADYDNDGDADIAFTTLEGTRLLNNNQGKFAEVTQQAGLNDITQWNTSILFFDADKDGWLDIYTGGYVSWSAEEDIFCTLDGTHKSYCTPELYDGISGVFYHNNGDGTFSNETKARGFADSPGKSLGVAMLDYDNNGWPDLLVSNDTQPDLLYKNNGDGTFNEVGQLSGIAFDENGMARAGMGIDTGFIDNSGRESIFVGNFSKEMIGVFQHIGDGLFVDQAARSQIGRPSLLTLTFGLTLFDIDLDGDLDLFTANGHLQAEIENTQEGISYKQHPHVFLNDGNGTFTDVIEQLPGMDASEVVARGIAYGDYDKDGDLDVLITENNGPVHLWENTLNKPANYLRVQLKGSDGNRDAIGARLEVINGANTQIKYVRTGSSYLTQSELTATFGLADATQADTLRITWPGGKQQTMVDVAANQTLVVEE